MTNDTPIPTFEPGAHAQYSHSLVHAHDITEHAEPCLLIAPSLYVAPRLLCHSCSSVRRAGCCDPVLGRETEEEDSQLLTFH